MSSSKGLGIWQLCLQEKKKAKKDKKEKKKEAKKGMNSLLWKSAVSFVKNIASTLTEPFSHVPQQTPHLEALTLDPSLAVGRMKVQVCLPHMDICLRLNT